MRKIVKILVLSSLMSCNNYSDINRPCGGNNPEKNLPWLKDIISKADSDKVNMSYKGNYLGKIYLEKYNNQYVFYSTMPMYSGGIYFHAFYCDGSSVVFSSSQATLSFLNNVKKDRLIYSNAP